LVDDAEIGLNLKEFPLLVLPCKVKSIVLAGEFNANHVLVRLRRLENTDTIDDFVKTFNELAEFYDLHMSWNEWAANVQSLELFQALKRVQRLHQNMTSPDIIQRVPSPELDQLTFCLKIRRFTLLLLH